MNTDAHPHIITTSFRSDNVRASRYIAVMAETAEQNHQNVVHLARNTVRDGRSVIIVCDPFDGNIVPALTACEVPADSVQYVVDGPVNRFRNSLTPKVLVIPVNLTKGLIVLPGTDVLVMARTFTAELFKQAKCILPFGDPSCAFTACYVQLGDDVVHERAAQPGDVHPGMQVACLNHSVVYVPEPQAQPEPQGMDMEILPIALIPIDIYPDNMMYGDLLPIPSPPYHY